MADPITEDGLDLHELTSRIVAAYVTHNALSNTELPRLIADVYRALGTLTSGAPAVQEEVQKPAISIRKSITPDYLICLEDGKKFKTLKRHLLQLGMTPAQYRDKWKLPFDYPMVAPNYSVKRSALAKNLGLGRKPVVRTGRVAEAAKERSSGLRRPAAGRVAVRGPWHRAAAWLSASSGPARLATPQTALPSPAATVRAHPTGVPGSRRRDRP